ncbi:MAG: PAS domain S-box protein [Bacteroidia bacterium]|nr:PAS domain S-box protein [Bacteroidia bacterium]
MTDPIRNESAQAAQVPGRRRRRAIRTGLSAGAVLILLGGLAARFWQPGALLPPALLAAMAAPALGLAGLSLVWMPAARRLADLAFLAGLAAYLGLAALLLLNRLDPLFTPLLAAAQVGFAFALRHVRAYLAFSAATMALLAAVAYSVPAPLLAPPVFLGIMGFVTICAALLSQGAAYAGPGGEGRLPAFIAHPDEAVLLFQPRGAFRWANPPALRILQLIGMPPEPGYAACMHALGLPSTLPDPAEAAPYGADVQIQDGSRTREYRVAVHLQERSGEIAVLLSEVTEARQRERSLARSVAAAESLLQSLPDTLITLNQSGMVLSVREHAGSAARAAGLTRFNGVHLSNLAYALMAEEDRHTLELLYERVCDTGLAQQMEFEHELEGRMRSFELRLVRLGSSSNLLLILRDQTETREVERALLHSEASYGEIFNAGSNGVLILDPATLIPSDANRAASSLFGQSREALRSQPLHLWFDPAQQPAVRAFLESATQGGGGSCTVQIRAREEAVLHAELQASLSILGGEFRIMLIISDITARIRQEEALRRSEEQYRTLVEVMNEGLVVTDSQERILFVNQRLCSIMGLERDEILRMWSWELFPGDEAREIILEKSRLRREGLADQYELALNRPDGSVSYLLIAGAPYRLPGQPESGTIAIVTDITHLKRTELKLKEKNNELDAFVYKASHDLRGPLASIMGIASIARDELRDPAALRFIDLIARSTKRLDTTLGELLDVTRINKAETRPEPVQLEHLVLDILSSLRHLPQAQRIDMRVDIPFDAPIFTDPKLLTSALQNLIVNAINYHNPEAGTPWVRIGAELRGEQVRITVADNGIGIPERMRRKVFEMFFRGNTQSKGSGLGLYIVKSAMEKLGGSCELESEEGAGSSFTLVLPRRTVPQHAVPEPA